MEDNRQKVPKRMEIPSDPFRPLDPQNGNIKFLVWGPAGSGKTVWSLGAENVAYISLESGADRYAHLGISAFTPKSLTEIGQTLRFLKYGEYSYETIVLDSISVCWSMFMEEFCPEGVKPDWVNIKLKWKRFLRTLLSLNKDVILIGRAKEARSESMWYQKTGDLILDSEISTAFELDFVGFSYTSNHPDTDEVEYKIRLDKVRDLTGKVKTGMTMTNSSFRQFKTRLFELTREVTGRTNQRSVHPQAPQNGKEPLPFSQRADHSPQRYVS